MRVTRSPSAVSTLPRVPVRPPQSGLKRLVRRVVRPVTSPIDGRVADINRRVDDARASVESHSDQLDGRIANLHSRVETLDGRLDYLSQALEAQSRALDVYVRSSAEASSYVGVELRRLHDGLEGLGQTVRELQQASFEQYYEQRLAQARELPLERLDAPLAQAINGLKNAPPQP